MWQVYCHLALLILHLAAKLADIIRKGAEYALTELTFHIDDKKIAALKIWILLKMHRWRCYYIKKDYARTLAD